MKIEDFAKTKEELEEQKKPNNKQIYISDERTRMANVNQFEHKALVTLIFSMFGYLLLLVISGILIGTLGPEVITSILPNFSFPVALVGSALGIGVLAEKLGSKKYKLKERLEAFSTAKTQADKLEEEIQYQMELEKAKNRNQAIDKALAVLNHNESLLRTMSSRYEINDKNVPKTEAEAKQNIDKLTTFLKEKYDELDLATTQKVLHDRSWKVRMKGQRNVDMIMVAMFSGVLTMFFFEMPMALVCAAVGPISPLAGLVTVFAPLIVGAVGASRYMVKRNRDYRKAFNRLNSKLGDNALEDEIDDAHKEQQELKTLIESITRDISAAEVQLKEQQRALEILQVETDSEELEQAIPSYTLYDIQRYQQGLPVLLPSELAFGTNEPMDETQTDVTESGPRLVKIEK